MSVQSASKAEPGAEFGWLAGQSRQEVEAGVGWYFEAGHVVQTPGTAYLPAVQTVQALSPPQLSPALQAPQSRQEVEAGAGWYFEAGQEVQPTETQSLKPAPFVLPSEWKAMLVLAPGSGMDAGNAFLDVVSPQYLVPPLTCK